MICSPFSDKSIFRLASLAFPASENNLSLYTKLAGVPKYTFSFSFHHYNGDCSLLKVFNFLDGTGVEERNNERGKSPLEPPLSISQIFSIAQSDAARSTKFDDLVDMIFP